MTTTTSQNSYVKVINKDNRCLFVFAIDQSLSMRDPWPRSGNASPKSHAVADCLNNTLQELGDRCVGNGGKVSHRCDIAIIGYGGKNHIGSAFSGALQGKSIVGIDEVAANPKSVIMRKRKISNGTGGLVEQDVPFTVWVEPEAYNNTPMIEALTIVGTLVEGWLPNWQESFPPIVINITDGEANDGDPDTIPQRALAAAERLKQMGSNDGNVLLVNCHISSNASPEVQYPASDADLPPGPDLPFSKLLFDMSSPMPASLLTTAQQNGLPVKPGSRLMVMNSSLETMISLLSFMSGNALR